MKSVSEFFSSVGHKSFRMLLLFIRIVSSIVRTLLNPTQTAWPAATCINKYIEHQGARLSGGTIVIASADTD